ncbi:MAG: hypothetical protein LIP02_08715 [Bacteroidales bacterium]|nr:hypothetical protein [Bacteroidales bacterium]
METSTYTARIIRPSEGMAITQAADVPLTERMVARGELWLAVTDDPENYVEITEEQAQAYEAEIAAYIKAEEEAREAEEEAKRTAAAAQAQAEQQAEIQAQIDAAKPKTK